MCEQVNDRQQYWQVVATCLAKMGITTCDQAALNWEAIEVLAERNGHLRQQVPLPTVMAGHCAYYFVKPDVLPVDRQG
jgi:hypothetical protein